MSFGPNESSNYFQGKGCFACRRLDYRSIKAVAVVQTIKMSFGPNERGNYFQDKGCFACRRLDYRSIKAVAIVQTLKMSSGLVREAIIFKIKAVLLVENWTVESLRQLL